MDPGVVDLEAWAGISHLVRALWFLPAMVVMFGGSLLLSLAVIPSLVASGHLPRQTEKVRPLLNFVAIVAFAGWLTALVVAAQAFQIIGRFWPRWWI